MSQVVPIVKMKNSRELHNAKVTRCDTDGFVVVCHEGTVKVWNSQVSRESYAELARLAPPPTPRPTPWPDLMPQPKSTPKSDTKTKNAHAAELLKLLGN